MANGTWVKVSNTLAARFHRVGYEVESKVFVPHSKNETVANVHGKVVIVTDDRGVMILQPDRRVKA